jgi:hypothetical protein
MKTVFTKLCALLITLPGVVAAEDYVVSGPDLSGKATVTEIGTGPKAGETLVDISVTYSAFGRKAHGARTFTGKGVRKANGGLAWTHSVAVETNRSGVVDWVRDPYLTSPDPKKYTVQLKSVMRKLRNGDLQGMVDGARQTWRVAPDSKGVVVLMIPGLSTNYWNRIGLPYFDENRDAMLAQGLDVRRIGTLADGSIDTAAEFKTENGVLKNAAVIAAEIRAEAEKGNRVILFAHSKGATDSTAAIALNPDLVPHVAGLIAIQPVYRGSPVANLAAKGGLQAKAVQLLSDVWSGGSRDAVLDITTERREAFVSANPYPSDKIPTVVIRSTFDRNKIAVGPDRFGKRVTNPGKRFFQRVLRTNQALITLHEGLASDGMVDLAAQTIPGATHINKKDLDHFEPGLAMISAHTPSKLTAEAVGTLFDLMAGRDVKSDPEEVAAPSPSSQIPGSDPVADDAPDDAPDAPDATSDWLGDWLGGLGRWWDGLGKPKAR